MQCYAMLLCDLLSCTFSSPRYEHSTQSILGCFLNFLRKNSEISQNISSQERRNLKYSKDSENLVLRANSRNYLAIQLIWTPLPPQKKPSLFWDKNAYFTVNKTTLTKTNFGRMGAFFNFIEMSRRRGYIFFLPVRSTVTKATSNIRNTYARISQSTMFWGRCL